MKRYIKTAVLSVLLFLIVLGSAFGFIGNLYNEGDNLESGKLFSSVIAGTAVDADTQALPLPGDVVEENFSGFDVVFDEVSYPSKFLSSVGSFENGNQQLAEPVAPPVVQRPVTPNDNTNNKNDDDKNDTPVQRPNVNTSISNIAGIIKGRDYGSGIDVFQGDGKGISTDVSDLQAAINRGSADCAFIAIRLSDGASVAYNVRDKFRCASTYKAVASLYIYKMAEAGKLSLNETLTYTRSDYYSGSGIIKSYSFGTKFTLGQLADYSIRYSDNIAFIMLQRYINDNDLVAFVKSLGCENYNESQFSWPDITALDASLWWAEIYRYSKSSQLGAQLYNIHLNATHTIIKDALYDAHPVAHKSGSISHYYHDCGIVESEDPYLIIMLSYDSRNYSNRNPSFVNPVIREIDKLMNP